MNPQSTLGGVIGSGNVTPSITPSTSTDTSALADVADVLSGGNFGNQDASTLFDPTMFGAQGVFSPTGSDAGNLPLSTPQVAQAQQDPSGQIIDTQKPQTSEGGVDRAGKGDRDISQPETTVDRTGKGDLATPPAATPAGPTGLGGQPAQQPGQKPGEAPATVDPRAPLQPPQSPLARLAAAQKQAAAPAAAAPQAAPAPQESPGAPAGAPPSGAPRPAPAGAPSGAPPAGAPPMGAGGPPPGLLKAIMTLLGVPTGAGGPGGAPQSLGATAQQAYPQRPGGPMTPTGRLGPYGRAIARQRLFQGGDQDGGGDLNYAGTSRVPPPGSTSEVSAPTADQVRQTRMAGTDTPPTEGFSGYLQSERAHFGDELKSDKTKWETLAMIALEQGGDPAAVAESLLNRANYAKTSIGNMLHSGFYGPINRGQLAREVRLLQRNPEQAAKLSAGLETAMRGSNLLGGATDQGSGRDRNVEHRGGRVTRFGEIYNDWGGGPGGHDGAAMYRRQQQQRVRQEQQEGKRGDQFAMDIHDVTSPARGDENVGNAAAPFGNNPVLDAIERMHRKRRESEQPASPETVGRKRREGRAGEFQEARLPTGYRSGVSAGEFREIEGLRRTRQDRLT